MAYVLCPCAWDLWYVACILAHICFCLIVVVGIAPQDVNMMCAHTWRLPFPLRDMMWTCSALVLETLLLTLIGCCRRCCCVVVNIAWRNVVQNETRAPAHKGLDDDICCCCSRVVIVVAIAWRNMIVLCASAQGFVIYWCFTQRNMKHTRGKSTTYVVVAAVFLSLLLSGDANMKQKRAHRQHIMLLQLRWCHCCCCTTWYEVVTCSRMRPCCQY